MIENVRMHIVNIITVRDKINNASFLITKLGKINFAYQKEEVQGKRKIFEAEHPASHGDVMHASPRPPYAQGTQTARPFSFTVC